LLRRLDLNRRHVLVERDDLLNLRAEHAQPGEQHQKQQ
jgi:hypothetical protein